MGYNDAASIDHLPGLKSLKMRVRHWGTVPYKKATRQKYHSSSNYAEKIAECMAKHSKDQQCRNGK